jgi:hypothetical protein
VHTQCIEYATIAHLFCIIHGACIMLWKMPVSWLLSPLENGVSMKTGNCSRNDIWRGLQWATFFPLSYLVYKHPSYIECTRYSCNILLLYVKVRLMSSNTIWPWFPMFHQAPPPPRWTNLSFILLTSLPIMHAHRMGAWNVPIRPLLMEIWGGTVVDFWVVWGLGDIGHPIS